MRTVNAIIGCVLLVFAVLHAFIPNHLHLTIVYGLGAFFAFATVKPGGMGINTARVLAVGTTAVMFFYFAGFFTMAPDFEAQWVKTGAALEGVGMLLSAFLMIPILSCYSCLLKAEGCEQFKEKVEPKRGSFFSVPEDVQQNS
ncbi:MAG: hypothetical protein NXH95_20215 [Pseudomonadaceae bacterium]|nr:hypothetical protein [Pseudomonadaceae bacterium]